MKKKIFLVTLCLFLAFFYAAMMVISLVVFREQSAATREKCLSEHYVIASALLTDMQALESREIDIKESMEDLMRVYSRYSENKKVTLAVSCEDKWLYQQGGNTGWEVPKQYESREYYGSRMIYMEENPEKRLCVYGRFPAPYQEYGLLYTCDFSDVLAKWRHTKNILFGMGTAAVFLLALFLLRLLEICLKPLGQIATASRTIAEGEYHSRLPVTGKDEVAEVAECFNRMAEQVENHIRLLEDAARQKQQFIDNFAHELRTPLTAVYGYAEYLQKASVSEKEKTECTQVILEQCKRLQNMAYQLLDLVSLREIEMETCSLKELFAKSEETMRIKASEKEIRLIYESEEERFTAHFDLMLSLLDNLIDNALKASPAESVITIRGARNGEEIIIEVTDKGIGMTQEELSHIKEAFYRVDKARSRSAGGAGLGLSICERIAGLHGGKLEFSSRPEQGTTAHVSIPYMVRG